MNEIWGLMIFLSNNQWVPVADKLHFDDDFWDYLLDEAEKSHINTILLDVGDGVQFTCCPEICLPDAWSRERCPQPSATMPTATAPSGRRKACH